MASCRLCRRRHPAPSKRCERDREHFGRPSTLLCRRFRPQFSQSFLARDGGVVELQWRGLHRRLRPFGLVGSRAVHMAAYPFPGPVTEDIVFRTNVMNNWNVLEAAEMNGIRKVIMASSINALGEQPDRLFATLKYRHVLNINQPILPRQTQNPR